MALAEVTLSLGDYAAIGGLFAAIAAITTTLLVGNIRGLGKRIDVIEARVAKVERSKAEADDVARGIRELNKEKADKHEFARESLAAREKLDRVASELAALNGKLDANLGVAAAVKHLADEFAKYREARANDR